MKLDILDEVHQFWFGDLADFGSFNEDRVSLWFGGARDAEITARYSQILGQVEGMDFDVRGLTPTQQVGLVILLDQFPRSIFRAEPRSYAFDDRARSVVKIATSNGLLPFKLVERAFLTICLAHSEHLEDQERALSYYREDIAPFAPKGNRFYEGGRIQTSKYHDIISRFGRFPHRNAVLGRETTDEERRFLAENSMAPF